MAASSRGDRGMNSVVSTGAWATELSTSIAGITSRESISGIGISSACDGSAAASAMTRTCAPAEVLRPASTRSGFASTKMRSLNHAPPRALSIGSPIGLGRHGVILLRGAGGRRTLGHGTTATRSGGKRIDLMPFNGDTEPRPASRSAPTRCSTCENEWCELSEQGLRPIHTEGRGIEWADR